MSGSPSLALVRDRVIADGLLEVRSTYFHTDPRQAGAIEGFELCRSLDTREQFERVIAARNRREQRIRPRSEEDSAARRYVSHRYATLQVEWVLACMIAGGWARDGDAVSGRAALKVGSIIQDIARGR